MIGITLFCVLLDGVMGRAEYLRRWAEFHQREAEASAAKVWETHDIDEIQRRQATTIYHQTMEARYRAAMYRLLTTVDDSDLPNSSAPNPSKP
jgi:hypothetical protein